MMRRVGHAPSAKHRYVPRPGAYAVLPVKQGFLLTCQMAETPDIQLPGGGIDPGESPVRALHREVFEETGWAITRPRRLGAFRRFVFMPEYDIWAEKVCHVYAAQPVFQRGEPVEPDHMSLVLSAEDTVAALGNDGDRLFVSRFLSLHGR